MDNVVRLGVNLSVALRRLRRDLARCETCPRLEDCQLRARVNGDILAAINQVTDEWNLGDIIRHG